MQNSKQPEPNNEPACIKAFEVFGDGWRLKIVDALRNGELRFKELQELLGINSATLTTKLKTLEEMGMIIRNEETINKLSVTYCLSKLGKESLPVVDSMFNFGKKLLKKQA
ncbi:MAG: helix-turn-helix domain-containing protein [Patescibacteria group bacterium]